MVEKEIPKTPGVIDCNMRQKMRQFLPRSNLNNRTPIEAVTENTPVISEYQDFDFFVLVWYYYGVNPSISNDTRTFGHWVRVSHQRRSNMCYWIIPVSGIPISDTPVQHMTRDDLLDEDIEHTLMPSINN